MDTLYIVMPAYNEAQTITAVVQEWHPVVEEIGCNSKLVIIDDGSNDGTYQELLNLTKDYSSLVPMTKLNSGHGPTCLYGYQYSIENNAKYIFQTDSDGQTSSLDFWEFWHQRKQYDFVIGTRFTRQDGWPRKLVATVLRLVILITFGITAKDANTPFRLMKCQNLKTILVDIPKDIFLSNVLITVLVILRKGRLKWLPIQFKCRQGGINSINMTSIFKIGMRTISQFRCFKCAYQSAKIVSEGHELQSAIKRQI